MQPLSSAELIRLLGARLFGSEQDLAGALDVNRRTVARWSAGTNEPGPWVWPALLRLIEERRAELDELGKLIAARIEPGAGR